MIELHSPGSRLRRTVRRGLRRVGIELKRYPDSDYHGRLVGLLRERGVATVLDVGANRGGFAHAVRSAGFTGHIHSFEPQSEAFEALNNSASADSSWTAWKTALGSDAGMVELNIAGNSSSSSLLPMLEKHREVAPNTAYINTEVVPIRTLDSVVAATRLDAAGPCFLKIDVQGFEGEVLRGASTLLASKVLVGVQLEVSFETLYEGSLPWREAFDWMSTLGMSLSSFDPVLQDPLTGAILQADVAWLRPRAL